MLAGVCMVLAANGLHAQSPSLLTPAEWTALDSLYLHLHRNPELSFQEEKTAARLAAELKSMGYQLTTGIGGFGLTAIMQNGKGPVVLIRTDLDGLPVQEATGAVYASKATGLSDDGKPVPTMHACGHDVHMTVWTGTARWFSQNKKAWSGTLIFLGQPAEERGSGARLMLDDNLLGRIPKPDYAVALHCNATLPAGTVGICPGFALANVDMMDITVYGEGGHGAYPHTTKDPVVLAARIITDLQTIVSREISPLDPAVITVGAIHGGTKGNVIPSEVKLELTLRSYKDEVRAALIEKIKRTCEGAAMGFGLPKEKYPLVTLRNESIPATYNQPELTARIEKALISRLGQEKVFTVPPVMGGEDFSMYGRTPEKIPISLFWLGIVPPEKAAAADRGEIQLPSLHSPFMLPDYQPAIRTGVSAMTAAVLDLLKTP